MDRLFAFLFLFAFSLTLTSQIKGVVVDIEQYPIESVHIHNINNDEGVISDSLGIYSIAANIGDILEFHHLNYNNSHRQLINLKIDTVVLQKKDFSIDEVNVTSYLNSDLDLSSLSGIKRIPSFLGEQDVLKYLATLPGVTSLGMMDAGIYVRGGNSSQNAYLVNGNPVADPQHIAGLLTSFDPYILSHSKFFKSGYPSKYNGSLAAYIDMKPSDYMTEDYSGEVSLGLLSSSVKMKIKPDKKKKSLLGLTFRQSYFQLLAKGYNRNKKSYEQLPSYSFNDLTISYSFPLRNNWEASVFTLLTSDDLPMHLDNQFTYGLKWGTFSNSLLFKGKLTNKIKAAISLGYNSYSSNVAVESRVNSNCKIRIKTDTHSVLLRTGILFYSGHLFRFITDTHSGSMRTPVPI